MRPANGSEVDSEPSPHPPAEHDSTVKVNFTCGRCSHDRADHTPRCTVKGCDCHAWRRTRPVNRERETMEYLGAARRFIRAAGRRVANGDEHELAALISLYAELDAAVDETVAGQKTRKSWAGIALATGTTREAAYQRWGKKK
jgi:hypothetical protein